MFGFLWRKPLIFDFWGAVRLAWALQDYYDAPRRLRAIADALRGFGAKQQSADPTGSQRAIIFYRYRMIRR
jgi:hypothetical protein